MSYIVGGWSENDKGWGEEALFICARINLVLILNQCYFFFQDELGAWSENDNGWGEEAGDDLAWEADQVIREKKLAERERRAAEQRRKKMERDAQRVTKKDTGKLATKLK